MAKTFYYWDPLSLEHDTGRHVECIARAERLHPDVIRRHIPSLHHCTLQPHDAEQWICRLHEKSYHDYVKRTCQRAPAILDEGDTVVSRRSYEVAIAAVNTVLTAADAVMGGQAENAFCAIRPPGHHALPSEAMGFCLFGNVAILAHYLQQQHGLERIAIIDWDVHHGNGTQHFFYEDGNVFFVSLHQHPLWPGTGMEKERGEGKGEGATLNIPLPPATPEEMYTSVFESKVIPVVVAFKPEFILISAGFDAHRDDPLGNLKLTNEGFAHLSRVVRKVAQTECKGRIISCLEGGYNLDALEQSVAAHVKAMMCPGHDVT